MASMIATAARKRRMKGDTENAADARMPGDAAEDSGKNFIKSAIKRPGSLHTALGVPQGQTIPQSKIATAAKAGGSLGRKARFAEVLKGIRRK